MKLKDMESSLLSKGCFSEKFVIPGNDSVKVQHII